MFILNKKWSPLRWFLRLYITICKLCWSARFKTSGWTNPSTMGQHWTNPSTNWPTDQHLDGWADGPTDGSTNPQTAELTNQPTDQPMDLPSNRPTNRRSDRPTNPRTHLPTYLPTKCWVHRRCIGIWGKLKEDFQRSLSSNARDNQIRK